MNPEWWAVLALGLGVGGLSGILGIGGGVFLIPGLMYLFGMTQQRAQGTTLAALVPPVGLFAALQYYRDGNVDVRSAVWMALGFSVGAFLTAGLVRYIPTATLSQLFGTAMLIVGMRMILLSDRGAVLIAVTFATVTAAWILFFILKALGRRHGVAPSFRAVLSNREAASPPETDYHI